MPRLPCTTGCTVASISGALQLQSSPAALCCPQPAHASGPAPPAIHRSAAGGGAGQVGGTAGRREVGQEASRRAALLCQLCCTLLPGHALPDTCAWQPGSQRAPPAKGHKAGSILGEQYQETECTSRHVGLLLLHQDWWATADPKTARSVPAASCGTVPACARCGACPALARIARTEPAGRCLLRGGWTGGAPVGGKSGKVVLAGVCRGRRSCAAAQPMPAGPQLHLQHTVLPRQPCRQPSATHRTGWRGAQPPSPRAAPAPPASAPGRARPPAAAPPWRWTFGPAVEEWEGKGQI